MVEFGEKVKQLREEKGMTQQTLAQHLYVTRQAVSRWECGARVPDLLTAKKIAQILDTSVDELVSGEEFRKNIEKESLLERPGEHIVQTILYTVSAIAYLLMSIFSLYSIIMLLPKQSPANTPAETITLMTWVTTGIYLINLAGAFSGLILSAKNRLTPKLTGCIMWLPYLCAALLFSGTYIEIKIKGNGYIGLEGWVTDFILPLLIAIIILLFFREEKRGIPYGLMILISVASLGYIALVIKRQLSYTTDLGFAVMCVHSAGKIGMALLLGYQAFVWDSKKRTACREKEKSKEEETERNI